jgi:hypothetical protein
VGAGAGDEGDASAGCWTAGASSGAAAETTIVTLTPNAAALIGTNSFASVFIANVSSRVRACTSLPRDLARPY